jgi:DNA-binding NtrC family response regulator
MASAMAKVLVVDNDSDLCEVVSTALEFYGHQVVVANSILEARDVLNSEQFDVALLDILLDDGYGYGLIEDCKRCFPPVEPIVMSGYQSPFYVDGDSPVIDYLSVARNVGAEMILRKPFEFDALNKMVCSARDKSGAAARAVLPDGGGGGPLSEPGFH